MRRTPLSSRPISVSDDIFIVLQGSQNDIVIERPMFMPDATFRGFSSSFCLYCNKTRLYIHQFFPLMAVVCPSETPSVLSGINRLFPLPTIVIDFNVYYTVPYTTLSRKLNTYSPYISHHSCTHPTKYRAIHFLFNAVFLPCSVPAAVPSKLIIPSIPFYHDVYFAVFVVIEPQSAQQAVTRTSFFQFYWNQELYISYFM